MSRLSLLIFLSSSVIDFEWRGGRKSVSPRFWDSVSVMVVSLVPERFRSISGRVKLCCTGSMMVFWGTARCNNL